MDTKTPSNKQDFSALGTLPPKGFRDISVLEARLRDQALAIILNTYRAFGFERIETPTIDDVRRFSSSEGGENLSMLFKIIKRGDSLKAALSESNDNPEELSEEALCDLALRYDLTVPLARYYARFSNDLPSVFKTIQYGPVWRAERPQKGRYRQFTQCDIDIIGGKAPFDEIELITATASALAEFGFNGCVVNLNDRGFLTYLMNCLEIATEYRERFLINLDKIDKIGVSGVLGHLSGDGISQKVIDLLSRLSGRLSSQAGEVGSDSLELVINFCNENFAGSQGSIQDCLKNVIEIKQNIPTSFNENFKLLFNPFLIRGMGYYTGSIFEITLPGVSSSIAGGGRYDRMIEKLSGKVANACGFSIGFERLVSLLEERGWSAREQQAKLAIFYSSAELFSLVQEFAAAQREEGKICTTYEQPKNLKAQLQKLKALGYAEFAVVKDRSELRIELL